MFLIPVVILTLGFLIMIVLVGLREDPPNATPPRLKKIVKAQVVNLGRVTSQIIGYGRIKTAQPVVLYSEVNGTLSQGNVPFQPAQSFARGDLLVKIDDRQIRLEINSAKSDLLNALATVLPEIKVDFPNEYEVWQTYFNNCNYDQQLRELPKTDNQKIKLFLSRFNVYKLYFQIRNLEIQLEKHYFYALFNGSVISADLRVGSTVRNGTRIGEVISLDDMEIEVPIPAKDIEWIDTGKPVLFTSTEISGEWNGSVKRIGKNIDTRTQTVQVFMDIRNSNKGHLFNGIFLKAYIPGKSLERAISVPRNLIYEEEYVYLVNNGKLEFRPVTIARRELDSVIINGGIADNDTLVTEVLQGVAEGMLAEVKLTGR